MNTVYLVEGRRTPQAKAGAILKEVDVPFLGIPLVKKLLDCHRLTASDVDEVIVGNVGAPAQYANVSRVIALESGLSKRTSAYSVHRNCASAMEAIAQGFLKVASNRAEVVFAGGVESMSQMPLLYGREMTEFFTRLMRAKSITQKCTILKQFRPQHLKPVIAIEQGLTDPFCGLNMGQTAELLASEFGITREQQDEYANRSHQLTVAAQKAGKFKAEIVPLIVGKNLDQIMQHDMGPREDSSLAGLAKMRPFFDRKSGTVTIGNSCPITDGGSMWLICSEAAVEKYRLRPMARMLDFHFAGVEPERMGLGPIPAMAHVLKKCQMSLQQMDLIEINEAFAAQVLSVLHVAKDRQLCQRFGCHDVLGEIPLEKLNVNGGSIALGHPVGSSGARIVVTLAHELKRRGARFGLAALCIGGGQGGAVVIENLT